MPPPPPPPGTKPRPTNAGCCEAARRSSTLVKVCVVITVTVLIGAAVFTGTLLADLVFTPAAPAASNASLAVDGSPDTDPGTGASTIPGAPSSDGGGAEASPAAEPGSLAPAAAPYVGVLSLRQYLATRAAACNATWARSPGLGRVDFYSHVPDGDAVPPGVVNLRDIPATDHWHTHKSFSMLRHVCTHHADGFRWFVRAVDDMYVHAGRLAALLATRDHSQQVLLGHPTFPVDDVSYGALGGRHYCLGGAGIVFSRPLLKAICPHLPRCSRDYAHLKSDVAIAMCVHQHAQVECDPNPEHMSLFYNTYERNQLAVVEELRGAAAAATAHPLKVPWMMATYHQHVLRQQIQQARQRLDQLAGVKASLVHQLSSRRGEEAGSPELTLTSAEDSGTEDELVFGGAEEAGVVYRAAACRAAATMGGGQRAEVAEATRLATTSTRLGHLLDCHTLIGGTIQYRDTSTCYRTQYLCTNITHPQQSTIATVTMTKGLGAPLLKKSRRRELAEQVVVLARADRADTSLLEFLMALKRIATQAPYQLAVYIVMTTAAASSKDDAAATYSMREVESWFSEASGAVLRGRTVSVPRDNATAAYGAVASEVRRLYPAAVVAVTGSPNVLMTPAFMTRCRVLVRPGRQSYHPYPTRSVLTHRSLQQGSGSSILERLWTSQRPSCVHASDLRHQRSVSGQRRRRTKHADQMTAGTQHIKVTSALDLALTTNYRPLGAAVKDLLSGLGHLKT